MDVPVEWVDARERLPADGMPVAAAATGRYPTHPSDEESGQDFRLVMPMRFAARYVDEDGAEHRDCFIDSDRVIRLPYGRPCAEPVTHWAALPTLPGTSVHSVVGDGVRSARQHVLG